MPTPKPLSALAQGTTGILEARKGKAIPMEKGQSLKIINTHGKQVIDFFAFGLDEELQPLPMNNPDFLSMQHTRARNLSTSPRKGSKLFSNYRKPMFTIVEDSSPGIHDAFFPACDPVRYRQLGVEGHHASCAENLEIALAESGYPFPEGIVPAPFNIWMNVPVQEGGAMTIEAPWFAAIVRKTVRLRMGDIPSFKLFENDRLLAFLDIQPLSLGHALVIPKHHGAKLTDIPDESLTEILPVAKKIAKALNVENYNILQNNGRAAHQIVDHIPKPNQAEGLGISWPAQETDMDKLKAFYNEIKAKI
ncbi:MAG: hypothetical protein Q9222_001115 [Ikaeria aurantiellina]